MAWKELFTTDIGLLSLFTIGFVVVIGAYMYRFVMRNIAHDADKARQTK